MACVMNASKSWGTAQNVLTKVAEVRPKLVVPYAGRNSPFCCMRARRGFGGSHARTGAIHRAPLAADVIAANFEQIAGLVRDDPSVITRDHAVDALGSYAATGEAAGRAAYPVLVDALTLWDGKQAARALTGLGKVAITVPDLRDEILISAQTFTTHGKGVVAKAAKAVVTALE